MSSEQTGVAFALGLASIRHTAMEALIDLMRTADEPTRSEAALDLLRPIDMCIAVLGAARSAPAVR